MRDIKMIGYETIPCWYELNWRNGIILRIHKDFAEYAKGVPEDAPIVGDFKKEFGFSNFGRLFGADLGFENVLKFLGQKEEFLEYSIPAFLCRKTGETCPNCNGTGKDEDAFEEKCLYCDGEGKNIYYDYQEAYAVSASLTVLFMFMQFPEIETTAKIPQFLCVNTITISGMHGGSLNGEYSRELVDYLRSRSGPIPEMTIAMKTVFGQMDGGIKIHDNHDFQVDVHDRNGWLNVSCPGDATGLHPSSSYLRENKGYEFSCHNVDNPMQQLTLLASLAALNDLARQSRFGRLS